MRRSISLLLVVIISLRCSKVLGFSEKLSGESILYGLSSLTENITKDEGSKCFEDMKVLYKGVENKHLWALKVLDASGHPETGFIYGNNLWIGSRSHCMDISNKKPLEINHAKIKHVAPTPFDFPSYALKFVKIFLKHNNTFTTTHSTTIRFHNSSWFMCSPKLY
ncbi:hypothetical protein WA026_003656 [Henosepilachna vigintioctopunctata]|uniref:Nose resistant-to-fluoxetine protein N-terminal domain-containing protein n=1 Tax=Henosepilachna vigintioctopunctata TaxID=420089 RepID=A0AAW1UG90_9CUCU